jgi:hypothetical protein
MTKERMVERERTVVEGYGSCWGGGEAFSIDNRPLYRQHAFVRKKRVTASQDDVFVGELEMQSAVPAGLMLQSIGSHAVS